MPEIPKNVLYYGREEPLAERVALRAGPLSAVFEDGALRYVRLGGIEILRGIYAAVRDHNWDTIPAVLSDVRIDARDDSFEITFTADHSHGDVHFTWSGTITGDSAGTVRFVFDGHARTTFRRNRIGFCVLHPARECADAWCRIGHVDGSLKETSFPRLISPHQPFSDVRSIAHEVSEGLRAEVTFDGDAFETEDQRNWTDASFKTYSTPLRLPFPVEMKAGTKVRQAVTLTLRRSGDAPPPPPARLSRPDVVTVGVGPGAVRLPRIGLALATHGRPLTSVEVERLRALNLSHLRADVVLHRPGWEQSLARAAEQSAAVDVPLEVAVFVPDAADRELARLAEALPRLRPRVHTWLVFHERQKSTSEECVALARERLGAYDRTARFGGGSRAYFTELNRDRPVMYPLDVVAYSINPQVHASDNGTLVETFEAQAATVQSARAFSEGKPVVVSPVTLRPRFNPDATGPEDEPPPGTLPPQVDVRQMSLFGAGWTLGTIRAMAEGGAESVTFYETTGWRGVMEEAGGCAVPDRFRSIPGAVFPLYHVLADAGEFAGGDIVPTTSDDRLAVEAVTFRQGGRHATLLANLGPRSRRVVVRGWPRSASVRVLDETTAVEAMTRPELFRRQSGTILRPRTGGEMEVDLPPFAVARLDG